MSNRPQGLFIAGTDTDVGKTYVAALVARQLVAQGVRVGVYKPAASGCRWEQGELVSDDALALWNAAGRPGELGAVCPQRFVAPLAPNVAARAEGRSVDAALLRSGIDDWLARSEFVLVEGAGGYFSPLADEMLVADLAVELGFPVLLVAANRLGVINQVLQAEFAIAHYRGGLPLAGVVLNHIHSTSRDESETSNLHQIQLHTRARCAVELAFGSHEVPLAILGP